MATRMLEVANRQKIIICIAYQIDSIFPVPLKKCPLHVLTTYTAIVEQDLYHEIHGIGAK